MLASLPLTRNCIWRSCRTFKIRHVCPHVRIQCVYDHLPVGWACDLHSSVDEARGWWCTFPSIVLTDVLCLRQEVWQVAFVQLSLPHHASLEEGFAGGIESSVKERKEYGGVLAEDFLLRVVQRAKHVDVAKDIGRVRSHGVLWGRNWN